MQNDQLWPRTISAVELCDLTGLSDQRHRQLAKESRFPDPVKGQYQFAETIRGLFRYYQEKRTDEKTLKDKKLHEEIKKLKLWNQQKEGDLIPLEQVERFNLGIVSLAKAEAKRMKLELPPKIMGLERPDAEERIGEAIDRVFSILAQLSDNLAGLIADAQKTANENPDDANSEAGVGKPAGAAAGGKAASVGVGGAVLPARREP